jgi:glycosyltransferase involved in cell wall biosynthesis/SAM-dependent methyltransferase
MNAKKPSVMMIISQFRPVASGAELQAERLAYKLADLGFPMQVLTQHRDPSSLLHEVFQGVEIHRGDFPLAYKLNHEAIPTLHYLIKKHHTFDILHNHQMWGHAVVATLVARWLGKKNIIKLACAGTFGDLEVFSQLRYAKWGLQIVQMADAIIAVSREIESELLQYGFAPEKIYLIPNGVDVQEFQRTRPIPDNPRRRFILLGRRTPQKGIDTALKAVKILADKGLDGGLELNFYGWDYSEWDYRQMARDLGLEPYVHFLPFESEVLDVYQDAYCLLLPSVGEGLSNVLLEAMSLEMPVIASEVSGTVEVVDHQKNGLLIPPGAPEALADAMELFLSNPRLALNLGRQARLKVQEHYSLDAVAQKYAELYDQLVKKRVPFYQGVKFPKIDSSKSILVVAPGCPAELIQELLDDSMLPARTILEVLLPPGNTPGYDDLMEKEDRSGMAKFITSPARSFFSIINFLWLRENLGSSENIVMLVPKTPKNPIIAITSLLVWILSGRAITLLRPFSEGSGDQPESGHTLNDQDQAPRWVERKLNIDIILKEIGNFAWSSYPNFLKRFFTFTDRELCYYFGAYQSDPANLQPLDCSPEGIERNVEYALGTFDILKNSLPGGEGFLKGKRVLEIGPGVNFGTVLTLACYGAEAVAVERFPSPWNPHYHPKFYALLRDRLAERRPLIDLTPLDMIVSRGQYPPGSISVHSCSLEELTGVPDESIDLVFSNAVFEHLYDLKSAFSHLARITRPGGLGLHQVDFRDHRDLSRPLEHLLFGDREFSRLFKEKHGECGNRFRPKEMRQFLESVGFEVREFQPNIYADEEYLAEFLGRLRQAKKSRYSDYNAADLRNISGLFSVRKKPA